MFFLFLYLTKCKFLQNILESILKITELFRKVSCNFVIRSSYPPSYSLPYHLPLNESGIGIKFCVFCYRILILLAQNFLGPITFFFRTLNAYLYAQKRNIFKHFVKSKKKFFASIHLRSNRIKLCTWAGPWCQFSETDELLAWATQQLVAVHQIGAEALEALRPMLRIHDILGWILIRIRGSMPLTNGSGSCYFRHWPSRCQQKTNFLTQFFLLITFWSNIYIIFQK